MILQSILSLPDHSLASKCCVQVSLQACCRSFRSSFVEMINKRHICFVKPRTALQHRIQLFFKFAFYVVGTHSFMVTGLGLCLVKSSTSLLCWGPKTCTQYSTWGLMRAEDNHPSSYGILEPLAFWAASEHWWLMLNFSSTRTPSPALQGYSQLFLPVCIHISD